MKNSKKIVTFSLAGVMALTIVGGTNLVAPKKAEAATTTIQFWNGWTGAETTSLNKAIAKFEKAHKNIKVKSVPIPFDKLQQKLQTTLQSSTTKIDCFLGPHDWAGVFGTMKGGVLADLNKTSLKSALKDEKATTLKAGKFKGKQIGFPESLECVSLLYNKDMVKKAPKTMDELIKIAKQNTKGNKYGLVWNKNAYYYDRAFYGAFGGTEFKNDEGTKTGFGDKAFTSFLTYMKKLEGEKITPKTCDDATAMALFTAKRAAFFIEGPWSFGDIDKTAMKGHWGIANIPSVNGKAAHPFMGVKMFYIPKVAKHQKEAAEFIKFMTTPAIQEMFNKDAGHIPANKKAKVSNWQTVAVLKQADLAEPMPICPQMNKVWTPVGDAISAVQGGTATPAVAAKKANATMNSDIAKMQ